MRIAYICFHLGERIIHGGVGRKITEHLAAWREKGHEARLFLHTPDPIDLMDSTVRQYRSGQFPKLIRPIFREFQRSYALGQLIHDVAAYQPDVIYLRYGLFCYPLPRIFQIAPVVVEINTNDVNEYRYRGPVFYQLNRLTRGLILGPAAGIISVTREIASLPDNQKYRGARTVIANGINLTRFQELPAPHNPRPRLAFVGSPGYPWHGVDKLTRLAQLCPEIDIDLIGYQEAEIEMGVPGNLYCHGFLPRDEVRNWMVRADAACGSLALHRNCMEEGSPLKVREYLSLGIPSILPYKDTDLSGTNQDYLFEIPNCENNVETHARAILTFVMNMVGRRVDRSVIGPLIDQRIKENKRLDFFTEIIARYPHSR
jgi:glycosyltransferase involved in cell wall biosynthesis